MSKVIVLGVLLFVLGIFVSIPFFSKAPRVDYEKISAKDIPNIFPQTPPAIGQLASQAIEQAKKVVDQVIALASAERTFANTIEPIDRGFGFDMAIASGILAVVKAINPDEKMRNAADSASLELGSAQVDLIGQNVDLYRAVREYYDGNARTENLTKEQRYLLDQLIEDFERSGLNKSQEVQNKIKEVNKELISLTLDFAKNIDTDNRTIKVTKAELEGMDERFIEGLDKDEKGNYILTNDYPVVVPILEYAKNEKTREAVWQMQVSKAFPANKEILQKIIQKRAELAQLVGFESYAALDLDDKMAKNPANVQKFLDDILARAHKKEEIEKKLLMSDLADGVLIENNQFKPWDFGFAKAEYQKKHYDIDKRAIAEYFPLDNTLNELFDIYHQFMGIDFQELPAEGLWNQEVKLIKVSSSKTHEVLGYLLLDLFPRADKFSHACEITMVPAIKLKDGGRNVAFAIVIANFPKPSAQNPSLLPLDDVRTFFHEFGHALHVILGATNLASVSGTNVKQDFVELPSQMLEEWLWDPEIIKKVSRHFKTGQKIPDELVNKIVELKNANTGSFIQRQLFWALVSLGYFDSNPSKDIQAYTKNLYLKTRPSIEYDPRDVQEYSFGHLTDYGAGYYGYMWSKVFALDVFDTIKKHGLLNQEIGKKYVDAILAPGGSADPNELLKNFLGREPNSDAFFKDLGL